MKTKFLMSQVLVCIVYSAGLWTLDSSSSIIQVLVLDSGLWTLDSSIIQVLDCGLCQYSEYKPIESGTCTLGRAYKYSIVRSAPGTVECILHIQYGCMGSNLNVRICDGSEGEKFSDFSGGGWVCIPCSRS